jgi:hypothetical protein
MSIHAFSSCIYGSVECNHHVIKIMDNINHFPDRPQTGGKDIHKDGPELAFLYVQAEEERGQGSGVLAMSHVEDPSSFQFRDHNHISVPFVDGEFIHSPVSSREHSFLQRSCQSFLENPFEQAPSYHQKFDHGFIW